MGMDGTFKDYCDVIRTSGEGAPIAVEVLRYDTSEVLKGEINGDEPLALAFSFAEEVGDEVGDDDDAERDLLRLRVGRSTTPARSGERADGVDGAGHRADHRRGRHRSSRTSRPRPTSTASSTASRRRAWCSPSCRRRPTSTPRSPSTASPAACTDGGITDYADPVFTGKYQVWQDCGGTANDVVTLVAVPADDSYLAVIQAQIVTDADLEALQKAFDTFNSVS